MGRVEEEIARGNAWFVGDQFAWADRLDIARVYGRRARLFRACIEGSRNAMGRAVRVLDAGCGDGYWLHRLGTLEGVSWSGFDYNPVRLERARLRVPGADLRLASWDDYTPDLPFDVVLLNQVIEHIPDDRAVLSAVRGWLRPGGCLILGTTNEGCRLQVWRRARRGGTEKTDHVHFYTESEMVGKVVLAGFQVEQIMREVFCSGIDRLDGPVLRSAWGFALYTGLTFLFPSQCSDFYLVCRRSGGQD
jgi:2-polyprenyl-3-methyl-5-hydroxy-6-metoxy-1,4-benzoquinol methylase